MTARDETASVPEVDIDQVERLARWASSLGPSRERDDMYSEALLRVLEALDAGCTAGLGRIAYRGAMKAFRESNYQAGGRRSRTAMEIGMTGMVLGLDTELHHRVAAVDVPAGELGPVLDRVVDALVDKGLSRDRVVEALTALTNAAGSAPRRGRVVRSRVADVPVREMAERSGLSTAQCAALKALVLGERSRSDRVRAPVPGLLARAHRGDDVWDDVRVGRLLDEVVSPTVRLQHPWAEAALSTPGVVVDQVMS